MENTQLSLFESEKTAHPDRDDAEIVRQLCVELLSAAEASPPVNVRVLASLRGVIRIQEEDQPYAGMITKERDGLVIRVSSTDGWARKRFSALHETFHTLLPGFSQAPQFRCSSGKQRTKTEALSDLGASELLFPRRSFREDVGQVSFDLQSVESLADRYEASIEATAHRIVDFWPERAALLVFRVANKPNEDSDEAEPKLRLAYSHKTDGWPFFRRHKSVDESGPFSRALEGEIVNEFGSLEEISAADVGPVQISARRYGRTERVLAIVRRPSTTRRR